MLVLNFNQNSYIWQILFLFSLLEQPKNEEIKPMCWESENQDCDTDFKEFRDHQRRQTSG